LNDPLTDEDAEQVALWATLTGQPIFTVAQHLFDTLPSDHSALNNFTAIWEFQVKLVEAKNRLDEEQKKAHS
jgi:hypothetical protein